MPSAKNKRKPKTVDSSVAAKRNLKTEINKAEKKIKQMISRFENGVKRHRWQTTEKGGREYVEINKLQGFAPDSTRHKRLVGHIDRMKSRLKELG